MHTFEHCENLMCETPPPKNNLIQCTKNTPVRKFGETVLKFYDLIIFWIKVIKILFILIYFFIYKDLN